VTRAALAFALHSFTTAQDAEGVKAVWRISTAIRANYGQQELIILRSEDVIREVPSPRTREWYEAAQGSIKALRKAKPMSRPLRKNLEREAAIIAELLEEMN
jgi:hypothetical protein